MRRSATIGLLGGSFDPIHLAHVQLCTVARDALGLDAVHLIPAALPWQKGELHASAAHRCQMVSLAIEGIPGLKLDRIEVDRKGETYTIDTLRLLLQRFPSRDVWLMGADQLANFCRWHDWAEIVALADLAVAMRPGHELEPPAELASRLTRLGKSLLRLPLAPVETSATDIRLRVKTGASTDGLLAPAVRHYIDQHQLYR